MSSKDRQLEVHGCRASPNDIQDLSYWAEQHGGPLQTIFLQPKGAPIVRITFKVESSANAAYNNIHKIPRHIRHSKVRFAGKKGDTYNPKNQNGSQHQQSNGHSNGRSNGSGIENRLGPSATATAAAQAQPAALAPAPRPIKQLPNGANGQANGNGQSTANINGLDTWEQSLYDSDFDDGFVPIQAPKANSDSILPAEWEEAFLLVKDFALNGGAILAADVEAWEHDHDDILEVGLAHINWKAGNGSAPNVRAEHIIIAENEARRNGENFYDRRDYFAFGESQVLSQDDLQTKLNYMIATYTSDPPQPLVFLFHNAQAEQSYFELMGVSLSSSGNNGGIRTRVPGGILRHVGRSLKAEQSERLVDRSDKIVLDTQRLYQAFLMHWDELKNVKKLRLGLGNICKDIGVPTAALHNGGNDAVYTLKLFMRLVEMHLERLDIQERERQAAGPSYVSIQERNKPPVEVWKPTAGDNHISDDEGYE